MGCGKQSKQLLERQAEVERLQEVYAQAQKSHEEEVARLQQDKMKLQEQARLADKNNMMMKRNHDELKQEQAAQLNEAARAAPSARQLRHP